MSFLKKILGKSSSSSASSSDRVRVCSQCGMPVTEHKEWCSILKGQEDEENQAQLAGAAE